MSEPDLNTTKGKEAVQIEGKTASEPGTKPSTGSEGSTQAKTSDPSQDEPPRRFCYNADDPSSWPRMDDDAARRLLQAWVQDIPKDAHGFTSDYDFLESNTRVSYLTSEGSSDGNTKRKIEDLIWKEEPDP